MRSPYTGQQLGAVSAAAAYPGFAQSLPAIVRGLPVSTFGAGGEAARTQLLGLLTQLGPILTGLRPTDAQVGSVLIDLNTRTPLTTVPNDYAPLGANFSNTIEAGYKGLFGEKFRVAADLWFQRRPADPTTQILNPGVLFNPQQLGSFLGTQIATRLIAAGTPAAQAQATATAAATALTPLMAAIPVGATAFTNPLYDQSYLVFSYQNAAGYVNVHGVDLASDLLLNQNWSLAGTYSWLSDNLFPNAPGATALNPLAANTPTHRATLTVRYEGEDRRLTGELRGRYANAFQVNSGVFNSFGIGAGQARYPGVPVNAFVDASASYRLPIAQDVRISVSATNLLDNRRPTFVGVADLGRLVVSRLQYSF
jgi:iron complex outermembrane receptor protein